MNAHNSHSDVAFNVAASEAAPLCDPTRRGGTYSPITAVTDDVADAVEAAYQAAFVRYHRTKTYRALVALQQANNARFKHGRTI